MRGSTRRAAELTARGRFWLFPRGCSHVAYRGIRRGSRPSVPRLAVVWEPTSVAKIRPHDGGKKQRYPDESLPVFEQLRELIMNAVYGWQQIGCYGHMLFVVLIAVCKPDFFQQSV